MSPSLPLLLAGGALLAVLCAAVLLLVRLNESDRMTARTLAVLGPYRGAASLRTDVAAHAPRQWRLGDPRAALAHLFHIETKWATGYPLRPGIVLAAALLAAVVAAWLFGLAVGLQRWTAPWLPFPVFWVIFSRTAFGIFARRRRDLLFLQLPDILGMIVRALRVGQTVTEALRGVARNAPEPSATAFVRLVDRLAIGVPLSGALPELTDAAGLAEYRFLCTALLLQNRSGGSLTEALETLSEVVRGRVNLRRKAFAMSSEARTSATVLAILPAVTFLGLLLMAPAYARVLLDDPLGRHMLLASVAMLLLGGATMHAMVRRLLR